MQFTANPLHVIDTYRQINVGGSGEFLRINHTKLD